TRMQRQAGSLSDRESNATTSWQLVGQGGECNDRGELVGQVVECNDKLAACRTRPTIRSRILPCGNILADAQLQWSPSTLHPDRRPVNSKTGTPSRWELRGRRPAVWRL